MCFLLPQAILSAVPYIKTLPNVSKAAVLPCLWFVIHSFRYLHLPLQYIITSITKTSYQNTRELPAHHLPGMICSGALKGGVISICGVHSITKRTFKYTLLQLNGYLTSNQHCNVIERNFEIVTAAICFFLMQHNLTNQRVRNIWPCGLHVHTRCPNNWNVCMSNFAQSTWSRKKKATLLFENGLGRTKHQRGRPNFNVKEEQYVWTYFGFSEDDSRQSCWAEGALLP